MVTEYGMSAKVGSVRLAAKESDPFLGGGAGGGNNFSDEMAYLVDQEVAALLEQAHDEAYEILRDNRDVLDALSLALLEKETLLENDLAEIFAGVRKRPERDHWYSKSNREPSALPPVKVAKAETDETPVAEEPIVQQPTVDPMDPGNPHPGAAGPAGNPDVDPLGGPR